MWAGVAPEAGNRAEEEVASSEAGRTFARVDPDLKDTSSRCWVLPALCHYNDAIYNEDHSRY